MARATQQVINSTGNILSGLDCTYWLKFPWPEIGGCRTHRQMVWCVATYGLKNKAKLEHISPLLSNRFKYLSVVRRKCTFCCKSRTDKPVLDCRLRSLWRRCFSTHLGQEVSGRRKPDRPGSLQSQQPQHSAH